MLHEMLVAAPGRRWKPLLGGVAAVLLLLPVPAFAFTWVGSWAATSLSNVGWSFVDASGGSGSTLSILALPPTLANKVTESATVTLTRTIDFSGFELLDLNNSNHIKLGNDTTLSINATLDGSAFNFRNPFPYTQTGGTASNQFAQAFYFTPGDHTLQISFSLVSNGAGKNPAGGWTTTSSPTSLFTFTSF